jgi:bifunctional enzyme CysN/CysC
MGISMQSQDQESDLCGQINEVGKSARSRLKGHPACVIWMTGLSGAGKSTIANVLEVDLHARGIHTYLLDGDDVRHRLNADLGFTREDRKENVRRIAEVARMMNESGLVVLVSVISPFRSDRDFARGLVDPGEFCEVFVDVPLAVAERRDPKGLYRKARSGQLPNFTGIDSPYEPPEHPDIRIDTTVHSPDQAASMITNGLRGRGFAIAQGA